MFLLWLLLWPFLILWTLMGGGFSFPNGIDGNGWE